MDPKAFRFLASILGDNGANALKKAADRASELESAILPRAIMAWISIASRTGFEGEIPGIQNTYIAFEKSEAGYTGQITIGEEIWPFQDTDFYQVAAAVALAVGADDQIDPNLRDSELVQLGKSIDILIKARFLTDNLMKGNEAGTGVTAQPRQSPPIQPQAPRKQTKLPNPRPSQREFKAPPAPLDHVEKPKIKLPGVKKRELKISKNLAKVRCKACGQTQFKDESFNGCICFRDLKKATDTQIEGDNYILSFGKDWDNEAIVLLAQTLGVK